MVDIDLEENNAQEENNFDYAECERVRCEGYKYAIGIIAVFTGFGFAFWAHLHK